MHRRWWITGAALTAMALGLVLWQQGRSGAQAASTPASAGASAPSPAASQAVPLNFSPSEVASASLRELPQSVRFSGPLVAPSTAVVRAKAAGTLLRLDVAEGSRVRQGQVLGQLDLAELQARLAERQALAESARAQLLQAERSHESNRHLAEQQFISPNALETSRAALETARAQLQAARAQTETVRIALREAALLAPISGIVAKRQVLPGEKVSAEQALLTLVDLRRLEMSGAVAAHEVGRLRPGQAVSLQIEGDDRPVSGRLARIAPAVDAGSRSIGVAVEIDNPDERLRAGQYASAEVSLPAAAASLVVPVGALGSASGQDFVWTLEDGRLLRRSVTTGRRDAQLGLVEVLQGLAPDTVVLARRFENLREGAAARVAAAAPAPGVAAPAASAASR